MWPKVIRYIVIMYKGVLGKDVTCLFLFLVALFHTILFHRSTGKVDYISSLVPLLVRLPILVFLQQPPQWHLLSGISGDGGCGLSGRGVYLCK